MGLEFQDLFDLPEALKGLLPDFRFLLCESVKSAKSADRFLSKELFGKIQSIWRNGIGTEQQTVAWGGIFCYLLGFTKHKAYVIIISYARLEGYRIRNAFRGEYSQKALS